MTQPIYIEQTPISDIEVLPYSILTLSFDLYEKGFKIDHIEYLCDDYVTTEFATRIIEEIGDRFPHFRIWHHGSLFDRSGKTVRLTFVIDHYKDVSDYHCHTTFYIWGDMV